MNEPMRVNQPGSLTLERQQARMRFGGKASFWVQAVFGATASVSWLIVTIGLRGFTGLSFGALIAFWATLLTLLTLGGNLYLTWQYWQLGKGPQGSLSSTATPQQMQRVIYISLAGAFLALISLAAQVGDLLGSYFFLQIAVGRFQVLGLLLSVANTNITLAHLISLTSALWINGVFDRNLPRS